MVGPANGRRFSRLDAAGVGRKSVGVSGVAVAIHRHTPDVIHLSQMTMMMIVDRVGPADKTAGEQEDMFMVER